MGLFNNESKEEKAERKKMEQLARLKKKFNLNNFDENTIQTLRKIDTDLAGTEHIKTGMAFAGASAAEQVKISYLSVLVEQNWIIINLLNDIKNK